ncbi:MAG: hypothetical protein HC923_10605 [Myxococcales bacterium]|nr:hypothetical protein [Myxococcales bacterium]
MSFTEATSNLADPVDRHHVARCLLGFALRQLAFGALFVVQEEKLRGWIGFGAGADRISGLELPFVEDQAIGIVIDTRAHYFGPTPKDDLQTLLLEKLGRPTPENVLVVPICVRNRVVVIFYGENGPEEISSQLAGDFMLLVHKAQAAFEQLLLRQKAESLLGLGRPAPASVPYPPSERQDWQKGPLTQALELAASAEVAHPAEEEDVDEIPPEVPSLIPAAEERPEEAPSGPDSVSRRLSLEDEPLAQSSELLRRPYAPDVEGPVSLPDEPLPEIGPADVDTRDLAWESVAVADANFVQGYELVPPQVLNDLDLPENRPSPAPVVTAPETSETLPRTTADLGSDGLRMAVPELHPRSLQGEVDDSDDRWSTEAIAGASTAPGAERPPSLERAMPRAETLETNGSAATTADPSPGEPTLPESNRLDAGEIRETATGLLGAQQHRNGSTLAELPPFDLAARESSPEREQPRVASFEDRDHPRVASAEDRDDPTDENMSDVLEERWTEAHEIDGLEIEAPEFAGQVAPDPRGSNTMPSASDPAATDDLPETLWSEAGKASPRRCSTKIPIRCEPATTTTGTRTTRPRGAFRASARRPSSSPQRASPSSSSTGRTLRSSRTPSKSRCLRRRGHWTTRSSSGS